MELVTVRGVMYINFFLRMNEIMKLLIKKSFPEDLATLKVVFCFL